MRRDLAFRGAFLGLFGAGGGAIVGFFAADAEVGVVLGLILVIAGIGMIVGFLAFRRPAAAVRTVADAAGSLGEGELALRVPDDSGPAGDLIHAFNVMAGRIEHLFDSVAAEHARLEAVFDASSDGMVALDREARVSFLNPAAVEVFGVSMAQAVGRPLIETARDYELDALVRRAIGGRSGQVAVVSFGPSRLSLRAAALPIPNGGDWAVLLMLTDLSEVQRVDQVRRDFLGNVSHELRTPLAAIRALVETLEEGVDAEDSPEFLKRIRQQTERLTTLVNELLDLSRIESGAINLHPEPIELKALVSEAASLLRTRTERAQVNVVCEGPPLEISADKQSLLRVVSNLLDNATKWSPSGSTVRVGLRDEGQLVAISVTDEGPGIAEQDIPRVFERFYKGEASRSDAGVGLGLAIVKHLVRAHGGTASVESPPGHGASFTVRLPKAFVGRAAATP
ncbi:MAG: ATP-binding protein [Dehalococcoidia bacterium]